MWASPRTWVTGEVVRARYFNQNLRDNVRALLGSYIEVATTETESSATYVDLATIGPQLIVDISSTGTKCAVFWGCNIAGNSAVNMYAVMAVEVSGSTTIAASDSYSCVAAFSTTNREMTCMGGKVFTVNPGQVTFTAKYRSNAGGNIGSFRQRFMLAYPAG